jgi:hypothetical protein
MREPYASLEPGKVDDYIDQAEQSFSQAETGEHVHMIRDLHYLYHKDAILARARLRLQSKDPSQAQPGARETPGVVFFERAEPAIQPPASLKRRGSVWTKLVAGLAAALLLLGAIFGASQFLNMHSRPGIGPGAAGSSPISSTATSNSKVMFSDPLDQNTHGWVTDAQHFFKDGAYHIKTLSPVIPAISLLPDFTADVSWSYSLTMTQIQGDTTSPANTFGMIFDYTTTQGKSGEVKHFYALTFANSTDKPEAMLFSYNNNNNPPSSPWSMIAHVPVPLHQQMGEANTLKMTILGKSMTLIVNGQRVTSKISTAISGAGSVGLMVNLEGSEVAFQNLLITRP